MIAARRKTAFDSDIDHIVSPEYRMSGSTVTTQGVYMDNEGTLHDSEYKMFPQVDMSRKRRRGVKVTGRERRSSMTGLISDISEDDDDEHPEDDEYPDPFRSYSHRYAAQSYYSSGAFASSNSTPAGHVHRHSYSHETPSSPFPSKSTGLDTYPSTPATMAKYEAKRGRLFPFSSTTLPRSASDRAGDRAYRVWPFTTNTLMEDPNDNPFEPSQVETEDFSPSSSSSGGSDKWSLKRWSRASPFSSKPIPSVDVIDEITAMNEKNTVGVIPQDVESEGLFSRNVLHKKRDTLQRTYTEPIPDCMVEKEETQKTSDNVPKRDHPDDGDWVPTCSDVIRQQWQTLALSLRLGLHRTKKRIISRRNS